MNTNYTPQSLGGQKMAIRQRTLALEKYYLNPNHCKQCKQIIEVPENCKVCEIKKKKFCNRHCAGVFNGTAYPKRKASISGFCQKCGGQILYKKQLTGGYLKREYCNDCLKTLRANTLFKRFGTTPILFQNLSKGELFSRRKNYQSARSAIVKHAYLVFKQSGKSEVCACCGYDKYVEICHHQSVSSFPDDALIITINDISNLIPLCRNHHWEFDHGLLSLDEPKMVTGIGFEPTT